MALRAVLFDLWETLVLDRADRTQARRAWRTESVKRLLAEHGFAIESDAVTSALDETNIALTRLRDEGLDVDGPGRATLLLEVLETQTNRRPPYAVAHELLQIIASPPVEMAPDLAPCALETLTTLRALGLSTALVSNTGMSTAPYQRLMLRHHGLESLLDVLVFSDEVQVAKPNPRIFEAALDRLGLTADEGAFVGDNPHIDIVGAVAAGLFAVQIGARSSDSGSAKPQARIDTLAELIPALRLNSSPT